MTWCLQLANFDVDVDLLFQENSTIGQKMYVLLMVGHCGVSAHRLNTLILQILVGMIWHHMHFVEQLLVEPKKCTRYTLEGNVACHGYFL